MMHCKPVSNHTLARGHQKVAPAPCALGPFVPKTKSQRPSQSSTLRDWSGGGGLVVFLKKNLDFAQGNG